MADFHQNGIVATLHKLGNRTIEELEAELVGFSRSSPMALVLPALYSEFETPSMEKIVSEIARIPYLNEVILGLDRADEQQFLRVKEIMGALPQRTRILWNDGPRLQAIDAKLRESQLAPTELGKGRNVWYCFGYTLAADNSKAIALHDCDIVTYDRWLPARLFYPIVHPRFEIKFAKGFYARLHNNAMAGRVFRLFFDPMIRALKATVGSHDYLNYLGVFRYALSGEFAMRRDVISALRIPGDWGLEVGTLSEMYHILSTRQMCQVDISDHYDHKHQDLSADDVTTGLARMSYDIAKSLYRKLATQGVVISPNVIRTVKANYYRAALDDVEKYYYNAKINGLNFDRHKEEAAIEVFNQSIIRAGDDFLGNAMETPFMPNWNRVFSAHPELREELRLAVDADNDV
jgi:glucosyl-3-phosphoglycerate synthase